jgi:hypothetical protein
LVRRETTDLTPAEFSAAAGDRPPISLAVGARLRSLPLMQEEFARMLVG